VPILYIPGIPHAGTAIKIALVGHLHIDAFESIDGWMQIQSVTVRFNPNFIAREKSQFFSKPRWQDDFLVFIDRGVLDIRHAKACSCLVGWILQIYFTDMPSTLQSDVQPDSDQAAFTPDTFYSGHRSTLSDTLY
jgi:hypothetical protein